MLLPNERQYVVDMLVRIEAAKLQYDINALYKVIQTGFTGVAGMSDKELLNSLYRNQKINYSPEVERFLTNLVTEKFLLE